MNAASMIHDAEECDKEISMADGESLKITSVGSVRSQVVADGEERTVTLTDVYLEAQLAHNIVSYRCLRRRVLGSCRVDKVTCKCDGAIASTSVCRRKNAMCR